MKTQKLKKALKSDPVKTDSRNLELLDKFIKNDLMHSKDEFVKNCDLMDYIKNDLKLIVNSYDVWILMRESGFKRGNIRFKEGPSRGYYAKLKQ